MIIPVSSGSTSATSRSTIDMTMTRVKIARSLSSSLT